MSKIVLITISLFNVIIILASDRVNVTGTVISNDNTPIVGATVVVKGNMYLGTITDADGNFSLDVPATYTLINISYVGMTPQDIAITDGHIFVTLHSSTALDEVVVTALGISREKNSVGYAVQELTDDELIITPQGDLNNALAGKVAGIRMWSASGATFDEGRIVLRGASSLDPAGAAPIYVVDGVITDVNMLDMNNVQSVSVLKGPAAAALYGSRGGNGAIIVTTTKPKHDKGHINIRQSLVFERAVSSGDYQNEYGGGTMGIYGGELAVFNYNPDIHPSYLAKLDGVRYFDYANDMSWGPRFDGQPYAPWYAWDPSHPKFGQTAPYVGQPTDNLKDLYRTGLTSDTHISFGKQTDDLSVNLSAGNRSRTGIVPNSDATRRYLALNVSYNATERINVAADYKYTYRSNHNAAVEDYTNARHFMYSYTQWFHRDVNINDLKNYRRPDGTFYTWNPTDVINGNLEPMYHNNPFAIMNEINATNEQQWSVINGKLTFDLIKNNLSIGLIGAANIRNDFSDEKIPYNIHGILSSYSLMQAKMYDMELKAFAEYNGRFFNNRLDLRSHLFLSQREYGYHSISGSTTNGLTADGYFSLAASVGAPKSSNEQLRLKEQSVYGYAVAGWDDIYYLDASMRNDWSSTLPADDNSYLYGGLALSVIGSRLLPHASWIDYWKLRLSAAQAGSVMQPFQTTQTFENLDKYGGKTTMQGSRVLLSSDIRPTISTSYETGAEARFFGGRLTADICFYVKDSKDQIIDLSVTPASGYSTLRTNAGLIRNKGVEVSISAVPVRTPAMKWEIYANWAKNDNRLLELDPDNPGLTQYQLSNMNIYNYIYSYAEVGKPIGVLRGSTYERSPDGKIVFRESDMFECGGYLPVLNPTANVELGNVQPDATGGFGTSLTWKNLRFNMTFDYQIGGHVASLTNMFGEGTGIFQSTVGYNDKGIPVRESVERGGGVKIEGVIRRGEGDNVIYEPVTGYMDAFCWYNYKSQIWEPAIFDASYLKMREAAVTYRLPERVVRKIYSGLTDATISINVMNPWLIMSGVPNIDASSIGNAYGGYLEIEQLFGVRSWGLTVNLGF